VDNTVLIFSLIVFTVIVFGVFWFVISKVIKGNDVVKLKESEIEWGKIKCPKCHAQMEPGYSMAGRGVIWRGTGDGRPGLFITITSVLENTMSLNAPPALNISWRCLNCKLILLDHSKMVKVKKA